MSLIKNISGTPDEIAEYLRNHPDFFVLHPELIHDLIIPHTQGKNVSSLIEYQVSKLRQQISGLKQTVREKESVSSDDKNFASNIHALSLELLVSTSPGELYNSLLSGLKTYYSADRTQLLLFSKRTMPDNRSGIHFMESGSKLRFMFTEMFHRNKPLCGSLQEEHLLELFGSDIDPIRSTVLLPMDHSYWQGLLVLGSHEQGRYAYGFGLDLLVFLKDIVYYKLCKFIASANTTNQ